MSYHYITEGRRNSYFIKYSDNIMIYHYITGERRNSYFIKYSDIMILSQGYGVPSRTKSSKHFHINRTVQK